LICVSIIFMRERYNSLLSPVHEVLKIMMLNNIRFILETIET
jgi:hypothetical protein